MSLLTGRTKKVATYGKRRTAIIPVHVDFTPERDHRDRENIGPSSQQTPSKPSKCTVDHGSVRISKINHYDDVCSSNPITTSNTPTKPTKLTRRPLQNKNSQEVVRPTQSKPSTPLKKAALRKSAVYRSEQSSDEDIVLRKHVVRKRRNVVHSPLASPRRDSPPTRRKNSLHPLRDSHVPAPMRGDTGALNNDVTERMAKVTLDEATKDSQNDINGTEVPEDDPPVKNLESPETPADMTPTLPDLSCLLEVCSHPEPIPFKVVFTSAALTARLPGRLASGAAPIVRKMGEASYSEVFGVKTSPTAEEVVVKVIPLLNGQPKEFTPGDDELEDELPDCSEIAEVEREIRVTRRLGYVTGGGFVDFLGALVVEGAYPQWMLDEWDKWAKRNHSENIRPDGFTDSQLYAFLILSDGGIDLESYPFANSKGWVQAGSVFWQVADALARAEDCVRFEHRDLHEGQVLVQDEDITSLEPVSNYLDNAETGVTATIIDFGLSRLDLVNDDGTPGEPIASTLPVECYQGIGAQWDVYREIRNVIEDGTNKSDPWKDFYPRTNVMWLLYLARRMLHYTKSLRKPLVRKGRRSVAKGATAAKNEVIRRRAEAAYSMLVAIETELDKPPGKGRKKGFTSARDVVAWGRLLGWIGDLAQ